MAKSEDSSPPWVSLIIHEMIAELHEDHWIHNLKTNSMGITFPSVAPSLHLQSSKVNKM